MLEYLGMYGFLLLNTDGVALESIVHCGNCSACCLSGCLCAPALPYRSGSFPTVSSPSISLILTKLSMLDVTFSYGGSLSDQARVCSSCLTFSDILLTPKLHRSCCFLLFKLQNMFTPLVKLFEFLMES